MDEFIWKFEFCHTLQVEQETGKISWFVNELTK